MVEMPIYLKDCTRIKNMLKDTVSLQIICNCGSSDFYLFKNCLDDEEENAIKKYEKRIGSWKNIENYTDPNTKIRYLVTRSMWGRISDKIPVSEIRDINRVHIIKVKCAKCGKEKVIFDNRYYGYNAIVSNKQIFSFEKEYQYDLIDKNLMEVEITIRNDLTYDEYCEEVEKNLANEYAHAFSGIEIYGIINGVKKRFFEEETA